jgi:alkanesulfonate monooxygenase SsuD/methylene tetrahydromethanopterin reductase-like flavin-dependent oxidoreductase (luciferase family)
MDFGVFDHLDRNELPLRDYYEARLKIVEAYDRNGFYGYHIAEHHSTPLGMAPSPTVFMSAIAQRTRRLRFGPLVFALPFYSPIRLIEEICMVDQMSGGRVEIGFGRGASPIEMQYHGIGFEQSERMYREGLEVVLKGLAEKELTHHGEFYHYDKVPMELGPFQKPHPPIWYGASSPDSAERAAANGLNIVNLDVPEKAAEIIRHYRDAWGRLNGTTPLPKLGIGRFIVVAETDEAALAAARRAYPKWHRSFSWLYHVHGRSPMRGERAKDFDALRDVEKKGIAGSPQTVTDYLSKQMAETGANYLVGQFAFGDLSLTEVTTSIDLFARHVMPALRDIRQPA